MYRVYLGELTTLQFLFIKNTDIHIPDAQRGVIIIYHCAELILEKVVYDILVTCFGVKFSM